MESGDDREQVSNIIILLPGHGLRRAVVCYLRLIVPSHGHLNLELLRTQNTLNHVQTRHASKLGQALYLHSKVSTRIPVHLGRDPFTIRT